MTLFFPSLEGFFICNFSKKEYTLREKRYKIIFFHDKFMINATTKDKISTLFEVYKELSLGKKIALREIALAEIPEMVYNSNAIENSTLSLQDTEDILIRNLIKKDHDIREVYEAKNLAKITEQLLENPPKKISIEHILEMHKTQLTHIHDDWAGRFRRNDEWVRVGTHL